MGILSSLHCEIPHMSCNQLATSPCYNVRDYYCYNVIRIRKRLDDVKNPVFERTFEQIKCAKETQESQKEIADNIKRKQEEGELHHFLLNLLFTMLLLFLFWSTLVIGAVIGSQILCKSGVITNYQNLPTYLRLFMSCSETVPSYW